MNVISELAAKYDIKLLWVNEARGDKRTSPRARAIAARLKALKGLQISQCDIAAGKFLPRDHHPNAAGYDVLKSCVEQLVRSW